MKKSAGAFIINNKKLLFLLRDNMPEIGNPNCWQLIGGNCEEGEMPIETLAREIQEETGIEVKKESAERIGKIIIPNEQEYEIFLIRLSDEEAKNIKLGDEGQKIEFISQSEFESMTFVPHLATYITNYKEGLKRLLEDEILDKKLLGFNEDDVYLIN